MSDVINISDHSGDGGMQSPVMCLEAAVKDFDGGVLQDYKKVLILALNDNDGEYSVKFMQAGMKMSQCMALSEVAKTIFLTEMGYIP